MVVQVRWSKEALKDVKEIAAYIRRDSQFYARIVAEKILESTRRIQASPRAGAIVPEIGDPQFRERAVYSYRIIYRLSDSLATVVAVLHSKRRFSTVEDRLGIEDGTGVQDSD